MRPVFLAPGASGGLAGVRPWVDGLLAAGHPTEPVALPRGSAERAVPAYARAAGDRLAEAVIGGHSFGGRVASLLAAEAAPAGLVLLSYPLHRPGRPDALRVAHWPRIRCPVLLVSGTADPFARVDLLRRHAWSLPDVEVVLLPGVRHGLLPVFDQVLPRLLSFVAGLSGGTRPRQQAVTGPAERNDAP